MEKAMAEIVDAVSAETLRENVATLALATLLSNPRLSAALEARVRR